MNGEPKVIYKVLVPVNTLINSPYAFLLICTLSNPWPCQRPYFFQYSGHKMTHHWDLICIALCTSETEHLFLCSFVCLLPVFLLRILFFPVGLQVFMYSGHYPLPVLHIPNGFIPFLVYIFTCLLVRSNTLFYCSQIYHF